MAQALGSSDVRLFYWTVLGLNKRGSRPQTAYLTQDLGPKVRLRRHSVNISPEFTSKGVMFLSLSDRGRIWAIPRPLRSCLGEGEKREQCFCLPHKRLFKVRRKVSQWGTVAISANCLLWLTVQSLDLLPIRVRECVARERSMKISAATADLAKNQGELHVSGRTNF